MRVDTCFVTCTVGTQSTLAHDGLTDNQCRTLRFLVGFNEGSTPIAESAVVLDPNQTYSFTYLQDGSVGVFYIDGTAALTVRLYGVSGKAIRLFAENNSVTFTDLTEYTN